MEYKFQRKRIDKIPKEKIIAELKKVAIFFKYHRFTRHEFDKVAKNCKGTTVLSAFGTWNNVLESIEMKLKKREVDRSFISEQQLFQEMDKIWNTLGHRPSKTEWESYSPKYSYTTYKSRFQGWTNACVKFIESKMRESIPDNPIISAPQRAEIKIKGKKGNFRNIPLKLRLKVLSRDNFRCVFCGRSPATDFGVKLHIDHIIPFSKGGKSSLDNLQTLCQDCNIGKSDKLLRADERP